MVLQNTVGIRRPLDVRCSLGGQVLQSRVIFITKWDNSHKVVQYREQMKETGEIDFGKICRKSSITEIDYSNAAGATLLKSLTAVDILLPILQEFRNIFLKEHLRKAAEATVSFSVMTHQAATKGAL